MSKCLLIHPIVRAQDRPRHVPYGLAQLAAVIKDKHEVAICDMNIAREVYSTEDDIFEYGLTGALKAVKWDFVGVGGLSSQYSQIKRIIPLIRKTNPQTIIIGGGGWSTYIPSEMLQLNPDLDIICVGESEETLPEILSGRSLNSIKGIHYRESGQVVSTQPRPLIENIDILPFLAYDLLEMELYFKNSSSMESLESMKATRRTDGIYERGALLQDTIIETINGNMKIQDVDIGRKVVAYDVPECRHDLNLCGYNQIKTTVKDNNGKLKKTLTLTLDSGKELTLTPEHPVFTKRGWIEAKDLREDDEIYRK